MVFSCNDADFAPSFTRRFDTNLRILSPGSQDHQTFDRERTGGCASVTGTCGCLIPRIFPASACVRLRFRISRQISSVSSAFRRSDQRGIESCGNAGSK